MKFNLIYRWYNAGTRRIRYNRMNMAWKKIANSDGPKIALFVLMLES